MKPMFLRIFLWCFVRAWYRPIVLGPGKVPAKGGSLRPPGPSIVGGMLFIGSGYAVTGGDKPGNVLLAFAVQ